jgi:single-stranded-DNA-specific exonuclease
MTIKNLKKGALRLKKAVKNQERIILYGDADLDGISSVLMVRETLKNLNAQEPFVYFPHREIDGYGLNENFLTSFQNLAPALLVLFDCGISNFEEVAKAKKLGFEVMIVDHHEPLKKLPKVSILINPKQKGDKSPFKFLATAGIVFKLCQEILGDKLSKALEQNFLELTCMATVYDMMPREADNQIFVEQGLLALQNTFRPGLKAVMELEEVTNSLPDLWLWLGKIINILSAGQDSQDHLPITYKLLTTANLQEAREIALFLSEQAKLKKQRISEIVEEVKERVQAKEKENIIFEGSSQWEVAYLGSSANKILQFFNKPVFLYKIGVGESVGGVRVPKEFNSVQMMQSCENLLLKYGGHPLAAGFRIKNENLEAFKKCLLEYLEKNKKTENEKNNNLH